MSNPGYGRLLQEWLPAVWRERDESGDLDRLLGVYGDLLDAFHATLYQRLYDSFPDQNSAGNHCQDWLLPYFAQLLDVRLVSPDEAGRRAELADAVAWRQRKGTRVSIEAIAEAVGRFEVEIQEGWKRVAIAPRIDRPLLPESVYGETEIASDTTPAERARHPGLPAATLDLRYCSRAVRCEASNPAAHATTFAGQTVHWRQVNRHGLPCAPDSYQDVSYRTVDLRTPNWQRGHFHPRRVPLYYAPQEGFFAANPVSIYWSSLDAWIQTASGTDVSAWSDEQIVSTVIGKAALSVQKTKWNGMTLPLVTLRGMTPSPLRVRGLAELPNAAVYRFENLWFDNRVEIANGAVQIEGCAARRLTVSTAESEATVVKARACLIKHLEVARGLVQLEYCTVLETLLAERLNASDAILLPLLRKDTVDDDVPEAGCIRYSHLFYIPEPEIANDAPNPAAPYVDNDPDWRAQGQRSALHCFADTCTTEQPRFWHRNFGQPGCCVLHPDAKAVIRFGAEDGGELGACHDLRYTLREQAVLDKLTEFLPVGMEAVLVADPSLACKPPRATQS